MTDHDRLFKELIATFFGDFCELFLPEVASRLESGSFEFLDKELFSDVTSGEKHVADLLARARWSGADAFVLIHLEHQAQAQTHFPKRMFRYFARLHEKFDLPVYPVVVYSFEQPRTEQPDHYEVTFPDLDVLQFRFRSIQLNKLSWRDFVNLNNAIACALMARMDIAPADRPHVKVQCLRLLATQRLDPARMQLISGFIDAYLRLNEEEERQFQAEIGAAEAGEREAIMQIVTSWMRDGMEIGRQEGRQEGRRQGTTALVLKQLNHRIGPLSRARQRQIRALPLRRVEQLGEALLEFGSESDLEQWLSEHR